MPSMPIRSYKPAGVWHQGVTIAVDSPDAHQAIGQIHSERYLHGDGRRGFHLTAKVLVYLRMNKGLTSMLRNGMNNDR